MRILMISDIHGNCTALEAVLKHMEGLWDYVWCLGDVVGYGPNPNECVERLKTLPLLCLAGNHDWATLDWIDVETFSADAHRAVEWTREQIHPQNRTFLESLPIKYMIGQYTLVHASPREPVWEYILEAETAEENFPHFDTSTCFVGHTHSAKIYRLTDDGQVEIHAPSYDKPYDLSGQRQIINVGSVGQPRDQNPDAKCGILNMADNTFQHFRVPYDIAETQKRIRAANLPERLAARLEHGW